MEYYEKFFNSYRGLKFWVIAASFVIVVAGIKEASNLVTIFLIALFLTAISLSPFLWLRKKKIPDILALLIVIVGILIILYSFGFLLSKSISGFSEKVELYEQHLVSSWESIYKMLHGQGLVDEQFKISSLLKSDSLMSSSKGFVTGFTKLISDPFLVFFIFIFMMLEVKSIGRKMQYLSKDSLPELEKIVKNIRVYFGIKTITSFATGLTIYISLLIIGVDFALLWGLLAFILNFIPSIGSIVAAIPVVILAFIQFGVVKGIITGVVYLVVNSVIGNIIEPTLMGRNLGLSPLVVFVSLLFWGYILGPVGMLIAAPLTMILKIVFDTRENTKGLGMMLGDAKSIESKE